MSKLTVLAQWQKDFLASLFATNNIAFQAENTLATDKNTYFIRGLQVYQANAHASALRSLQTAYPVVEQLIGEDTFAHLARDFWARHPPTRGDLTQWGGELSGFIASIAALQTEPYLSDVAITEWALHTAATVADQAADLATFALLTQHDSDTLTFQLAPGITLIDSNFPIASILTAHLYTNPSLEQVGQKLRDKLSETALVWRQGLRPIVSSCSAGEAAFIRRLLAGKSLLAALETSFVDEPTPFDFNAWLLQAVQSGLLLGVRLR
jgi:Putative DNA-binding domain